VVALLKFFAGPAGIGPTLATFLYSALMAPAYEAARRDFRQEPEIAIVLPYLEYVTRDDDAVRPNHAALHGFVARADWKGWEREILPPQGWRCRCRVIDISWEEAVEKKYRGTFPLGTKKLKAFRELGGTDAKFPRELFVVGALASLEV
jgi:SPP1 gp7 family putative phage head morphogenesis protein